MPGASGAARPARRRRLRRALAIAALGLAAIALLAWLAAGRLVESALEAGGSRLLGGPVEIGGLDLAPRGLDLRDVRASASAPGAAPWLRIGRVRIRLAGITDLAEGRHLRIAELALGEVALTLDSGARGPATLAAIEDRALLLLGLERDKSGAGFVPAARGDLRALPWTPLHRVSIARLTVEGLRLTAIDRTSAGATKTSRLEVSRAVVRELELAAEGGAGGSVAIALAGVSLRDAEDERQAPLVRAARLRASGEVAPAAGGADAASKPATRSAAGGPRDVVLHRARASEVWFRQSSAADPGGLVGAHAVWRAAAAGVQLPAIEGLRVERAQLRGAAIERLDLSPDPPVAVRAIEVALRQLSVPARGAAAARARVRAHPVTDETRFALRAEGPLGDPSGPGPIALTARVVALPLAPFSEFYLTAGELSGRARMTLARGTISGTAEVRIAGAEATSDAPLTLAVAYRALAAVSRGGTPELAVPFTVPLEEPTRVDASRAVLDAVVASARTAAGRSLAAGVPALDDAVREGVDRAKGLIDRLP